jgi:hypothetical protein
LICGAAVVGVMFFVSYPTNLAGITAAALLEGWKVYQIPGISRFVLAA